MSGGDDPGIRLPLGSLDELCDWLGTLVPPDQRALIAATANLREALPDELIRLEVILTLERELATPFPAELIDVIDNVAELFAFYEVKRGHR